jgi:hypothetical protein
MKKILILLTSVSGSLTFCVDPDPAIFVKDKKSKRSHKTVGIKVFLTIFAC